MPQWLSRLERAIEERLEGSCSLHPLELTRQAWGLLSQHPRPGGFCPNRLILPAPVDAVVLEEVGRHILERGWRLPAPLHVLQGPLGLVYAQGAAEQEARAIVEVVEGMSKGKQALFRERLLIGRAEEAGLRLGDPQVSRRHCELLANETGLWLGDQKLRSGQTWEVGANTLQVWSLV